MNIDTKIVLQLILATSLLFLIYCFLSKKNILTDESSKKEGFTLTEYDKRMLFTKPWNQFCLSPPPSWNGVDFMEKPSVLGIDPVGNWCKNYAKATSPPEISEECQEKTKSYFYESINPIII